MAVVLSTEASSGPKTARRRGGAAKASFASCAFCGPKGGASRHLRRAIATVLCFARPTAPPRSAARHWSAVSPPGSLPAHAARTQRVAAAALTAATCAPAALRASMHATCFLVGPSAWTAGTRKKPTAARIAGYWKRRGIEVLWADPFRWVPDREERLHR